MNQSESITDLNFIHAIQQQYLAVADEFISRVVYATEHEGDDCIIFEVVLAVDTPEESEELPMHYSDWLTWNYSTRVESDTCPLRRSGLLQTGYDYNEPHVMTATFKFMNDPAVIIERIVNNSIGADFEYNTHNFSHIQYFLDQLRRIIIEHDQEKYTFDEADFPPAFTA